MTLPVGDEAALKLLRKGTMKDLAIQDWEFIESSVRQAGGIRHTTGHAGEMIRRAVAMTKATGPASTPAPKEDQISGSSRNAAGSASSQAGSSKVQLTAAVETSLQNKADEHNKKMSEAGKPEWTRVRVGALRSVYRRGAGAFSVSHRPGMTRGQWAMGRVNAFLYLSENGKPENTKYVTDNDLLNSSHPKYSKVNKAKPMKTEDGVQYPADAFAYVPDPEMPSTWKLRLWDSLEEKETRRQVGMAVAALGKGFRGNKVQIPEADRAAVMERVARAWKKVNPDLTEEDMPSVIKGRYAI